MGSTEPPTPEPDTRRITLALDACAAGAPAASEELFALVYEGLRSLALRRMSGERSGHTLQPTALVHEAYVRLVGNGQVAWHSRAHFFAAAGEAMRRILVERARARARVKRGGDGTHPARRIPLSDLNFATEPEPEVMLVLDEALADLERDDPQAATIVRLRFFAGLSVEEAAEALGVSPRSVDRDWAYARARLHRQLRAASE
ncbi:MAG: sigma-70 family RNA polymerase sigma factor [Phycisphaerales bacterium]|nr:sigma-70 family RNA polymerase sigma factor [Phycisphaerales bacterium]